jgi:hypothetical protein
MGTEQDCDVRFNSVYWDQTNFCSLSDHQMDLPSMPPRLGIFPLTDSPLLHSSF